MESNCGSDYFTTTTIKGGWIKAWDGGDADDYFYYWTGVPELEKQSHREDSEEMDLYLAQSGQWKMLFEPISSSWVDWA